MMLRGADLWKVTGNAGITSGVWECQSSSAFMPAEGLSEARVPKKIEFGTKVFFQLLHYRGVWPTLYSLPESPPS